MQNLMTVAAAKAVKAPALKTARNELEVGSHDVDFWVRIVGSLNVGEDYDSAATVAIPYRKAFAALCYVSGVTGKAGVNMIRKAMEIALADDNDVTAKDALDRICPAVEAVERDVIQPMINSLPRIPCKGKVTTDFELNWQAQR